MTSARAITRIVLQPLLVGLFAALIVRATLLQAYSIPSASMSPTLQVGDHILVTPLRVPFAAQTLERGDVVVFRNPRLAPGFFVKRVIAVPGDSLEIRGGAVWINGRAEPEPYVMEGRTEGRISEIIPAGHLFVMGDHRSDSIDSRSWGLLEEGNVVGKARVIFWSSSPREAAASSATSTESAEPPVAPRWSRLLRPIR